MMPPGGVNTIGAGTRAVFRIKNGGRWGASGQRPAGTPKHAGAIGVRLLNGYREVKLSDGHGMVVIPDMRLTVPDLNSR